MNIEEKLKEIIDRCDELGQDKKLGLSHDDVGYVCTCIKNDIEDLLEEFGKEEPSKANFPNAHNNDMFRRSGGIISSSRWVAFLYIAMRDGDISPGRVEDILEKHVLDLSSDQQVYSNGYLAQYAIDISGRLKDG